MFAAIGGGVGLGRWPYALGIQAPGGLVDLRAEAHDHWASWWRFTQAETHGRRVVVGRWVCVLVRAAAWGGLWLVAGSQDRGPAVAEVWVGVGLADFSGSKPCPWGF